MANSDDILARLGAIEDPRELIRGLFENAPTPYAIFDRGGHCLLTNPAYRHMFGAEPPPEYSLLQDEVAAALGLAELFAAAYDGQTVRTSTFWYDPKALKHVHIEGANRVAIACTLFPLRAGSGEVTHVAITYNDLTAELTAKSAVEAERDLVHAILQQSGDGIIVADKHGAIQIFNAEAERQHGVTGTKVNAPEWSAAYGLHRLDGTPLPLEHTPLYLALHGQRVENAAWLVRSGNSGPRLLSGTATPLKNSEGEVTGAVLITRDETERKAAEQHLRLLAEASAVLASTLIYEETFARVARLLVPTLADWCFVDAYDGSGHLAHLAVVHAAPHDEALAQQALRLPIDPEMAPPAQAELVAVVDAPHLQQLGADVAHARFWQQVNPRSYLRVPLRARGRVLGTFTFLMTRSGRTFLPDDLAAAEELATRTALAADNARLYRQSREAAERAERANRAKDEFMAVLGHELRNPLAPIASALDIIRARTPLPLDSQHKIIGRQVQHLRRLVDDLLDVSRITTGKVELERQPVAVMDLLNQALELASPLIEQKQHRLELSPPEPSLGVSVDATRLVQVLVNLLTNAAKYTPAGGTITVAADTHENTVQIRIRDTGIGISADMIDQVFDIFVQGKQESDRAQGGLGLGLNIAQSLVKLHGGTIRAASPGLGKGTEFTVCIPGALQLEDHADMPSEPIALDVAVSQRRIIIVDDNQDAADLLGDLLRDLGHTVQVAYDGPSALAVVAEFKPDLALVDIGLPIMDGHEVATRLRRNPATSNLRLVALTGYGQDSDRRRSFAAGFDEHLIKPIDLPSLQRVISGGA